MAKFDPNKNPIYILVYAAVISAVFTAAIVGLHVATRDVVERNEKVMEQKAVVDVFGLGDIETMSDEQIIDAYAQRIVRVPIEGDPVGRAYYFAFKPSAGDDGVNEKPFAFAIPIHGVGFWAQIEGLLAIDVETRKVVGVAFLSHSETPGLGGRITEPDFRNEWKGLDMTPPKDDSKWIYIGGTETPGNKDRHVDAISGATGTSTRVAAFTNVTIPEYYQAAVELAGMSRSQLEALAQGQPRSTDTGMTPGEPTPLTPQQPQEEN